MFENIPSLLLGDLGESFAAQYFKNLGHNVTIPENKHCGDLVVDNVHIEVKTIRKGKDGSYAATIRKPKSQTLINVDFILLYVITEDYIYPYIIPANEVPHIKRIHITSHPNTYAGRFSSFTHNWQPLLDHMKITA